MRESVNIQLPEDISDITLEQSQRYLAIAERDNLSDIDKTKRVVKLFTGLKTKEVDAMSITTYEYVVGEILAALNTKAEFTQIFTLGGIEVKSIYSPAVISSKLGINPNSIPPNVNICVNSAFVFSAANISPTTYS